MTELTDHVVVISGASAGIGRATAVHCARHGAQVVLVARDESRLSTLAAELEGGSKRHLIAAGDIGDETTAVQIVESAIAVFGRVDILINNAGIGHRNPLADMDPADMRRLLDTNVLGLLYLTQQAIAPMRAQGAGHIVNVSSIVGERPLPDMGLYTASKTAVNHLSRTLRFELRDDNIQVTTVYPGRTLTEFGNRLLGNPGTDPNPIGRVNADRVASAIINGIRRNKRDVYVTPSDWLFTHLNRLFPRTTDWLITHLAQRH